MAIEGQVQYLHVLLPLVPPRKPVNQYLLSPQLMRIGVPTLAYRLPAKAGHLSHGLTHLPVPATFLSFPRLEYLYMSSETPTYSNTFAPTSYGFTLSCFANSPKCPRRHWHDFCEGTDCKCSSVGLWEVSQGTCALGQHHLVCLMVSVVCSYSS